MTGQRGAEKGPGAVGRALELLGPLPLARQVSAARGRQCPGGARPPALPTPMPGAAQPRRRAGGGALPTVQRSPLTAPAAQPTLCNSYAAHSLQQLRSPLAASAANSPLTAADDLGFFTSPALTRVCGCAGQRGRSCPGATASWRQPPGGCARSCGTPRQTGAQRAQQHTLCRGPALVAGCSCSGCGCRACTRASRG